MCVSMAAYTKYAARSRGDRGQVGLNGYFPAANFTYCPVDDATCNACKAEWRSEFWSKNQQPPPAVCHGADGCVCISACEMPDRAQLIVMNTCTMFGFDRSKLVTSAYVGAGVFGVLVLLFIMVRSWSTKRAARNHAQAAQERQELRERRRQRLRERQQRTGPLLGLGGWNSLRDKLLETERERGQPSLAGIGVVEREQRVSFRASDSDRVEDEEEARGALESRTGETSAPSNTVLDAAEGRQVM
ncbi:hypothetical protein PybrP1_007564 [[Pythium] brassicae (nom. inval.)]|nr:hypothetical protein PybrP1_007564 [[Pythium] brassicae (nom. inval.)]